MLYVCALSMELRIPASGSLKAKRTVVKHMVETAKSRFGVPAAEVGNLGKAGMDPKRGNPEHGIGRARNVRRGAADETTRKTDEQTPNGEPGAKHPPECKEAG